MASHTSRNEHLGVARQSVHYWIARYEAGGLAALADRSHRPTTCAHQIRPELEAMICENQRKGLHAMFGRKPANVLCFIVLRRHRLDAGEYSFAYVARWAEGSTDLLKETGSGSPGVPGASCVGLKRPLIRVHK